MTITKTKTKTDSKALTERVAQLEDENAHFRQEKDDLKRIEERLRTLLNLVDNAHSMVFQLSTNGVIEFVSPGVKKIYGYEPDELIGKLIEKITPLSELPKVVKALKRALSGETILNLEIGQLDSNGGIVIAEINGAPVIRDDKVIGMQGIIRDITTRKKAEEAARDSTLKLIKAMEDTMQAMAMIVEMRDPYTAGHQRRVAQLAVAIAQEMGCTPDQVTGLRLAGLIHDIGKVRVPAEILTNPDGLSDAEMAIIKMHPRLGYDVLKTLDSPWPIAEIVNQHHERIDGSGYPRGLAGKDIILEARVLAVADVVEAITYQRPYRRALGIDKALEEISKHKNILYDAAVVDSCLKLFTERGFRFQ